MQVVTYFHTAENGHVDPNLNFLERRAEMIFVRIQLNQHDHDKNLSLCFYD